MLVAILLGGCATERTPMEEAERLHRYGEFEASIAQSESVVEAATTEDEKSKALQLIGRCHLELAIQEGRPKGDHVEQAIEAFTKSIEIQDNADARHGRRRAYRQSGRDDLAALDYQRIREIDPNYASAYVNEKPETIRDYSDLEIDLTEDEDPASETVTDRSDDEYLTEDPSEQDFVTNPNTGTQNKTGVLLPNRRNLADEGSAEEAGDALKNSDSTTRISNWMHQHEERIELPSESQESRFENRRSPLLDEQAEADEELADEEGESEDASAGRSWPSAGIPDNFTNNGGGSPLNPTAGVPTTGIPTPGLPTTGLSNSGVPTTGIPTTGVPTSSNLPPSTAPTTGIGGSLLPFNSGAGFAGILPSAPTTGVGSAPIPSDVSGLNQPGLNQPGVNQPAINRFPTPGGFQPQPNFPHGVPLPIPNRSGNSSLPSSPSAGIPAEMIPFGPGSAAAQRMGPIQFQTSPLSQPQTGRPISSVPTPTINPASPAGPPR